MVVTSSGPMPCSHHIEPSAFQISPGVGRLSKGDVTQMSRAVATQKTTIRVDVARLVSGWGRKARAAASANAISGGGAEHDLDAAVLGPTVGRGVRPYRLRHAVSEDLDASFREVRGGLLLEPRFDGERAIFGELLVG